MPVQTARSSVLSLELGASLELGVWNLELVAWSLSFSKVEMRPINASTPPFVFPIDLRDGLRCTRPHDSKELSHWLTAIKPGRLLHSADDRGPRGPQAARPVFRPHGFATGHAPPDLGLGRRRRKSHRHVSRKNGFRDRPERQMDGQTAKSKGWRTRIT